MRHGKREQRQRLDDVRRIVVNQYREVVGRGYVLATTPPITGHNGP